MTGSSLRSAKLVSFAAVCSLSAMACARMPEPAEDPKKIELISVTGFVGESSASGANSVVEIVSIAGAALCSSCTGAGAASTESRLNTKGEEATAASSAFATASESL